MGPYTEPCDRTGCPFNIDGKCLDMDVLKNPYKQTGCIYYENMTIKTKSIHEK